MEKIRDCTSWSFTTPAQKDTLTPVWNYSAEVEVWSRADQNKWILEVWDKDFLKDDFVGRGRLELTAYSKSDGKETRTISAHPVSMGSLDTKTINAQIEVEIEVLENLT
jgi:Ca2+-dependent lipid-binding protein